jgi:uncharacterized protein YegP (UPF0339 family)
MANPRFQISKSSDNQFYFNLHAANGEKILTSERYTARDNAVKGIAAVKDNSQTDSRYSKLPSGSQFYFTLKAANGETIGTSEMYTTSTARDQGIESVKKNAPIAPTEG